MHDTLKQADGKVIEIIETTKVNDVEIDESTKVSDLASLDIEDICQNEKLKQSNLKFIQQLISMFCKNNTQLNETESEKERAPVHFNITDVSPTSDVTITFSEALYGKDEFDEL